MDLVSSVRRRVHFSVYVHKAATHLKITCPPYPFLFDILYKKVSGIPLGTGKRLTFFYSVLSVFFLPRIALETCGKRIVAKIFDIRVSSGI